MQSSDALIVGAALSDPACKGIFSLDRDVEAVTSIDIFTTIVKNSDFDAPDIIQKLNIEDYLIEILGEDAFYKKFNLTKPQ